MLDMCGDGPERPLLERIVASASDRNRTCSFTAQCLSVGSMIIIDKATSS